jgi:hypothetical protein
MSLKLGLSLAEGVQEEATEPTNEEAKGYSTTGQKK